MKQWNSPYIKTWIGVVFAGVLVSLFQNCSQTRFSASDSATVDAAGGEVHQPNSCDNQLRHATVPIKTLFIVDMSGSNVSSPGTDPDKSLRGGSIQTYFDDYKAKANFAWGFIGFQGTKASALIANGSSSSAKFSANSNDMQSAIAEFYGHRDNDNTPYKAALNMASSLIASDSLAASSDTKYVIVFLSDGMPSDYSSMAGGDAQLMSDVSALVKQVPGRVSFNTIYYGPDDASASARLQNMAAAGDGQFLDTNSNATGKSFFISDVINIPGETCN